MMYKDDISSVGTFHAGYEVSPYCYGPSVELDGSNIDERIPVVRNLREAEQIAGSYNHVITVGPDIDGWGHPDHFITVCSDVVSGVGAPTFEQIAAVLEWASVRDGKMLVHCHAGISRSTATAVGVLIGRGESPEDALQILLSVHPHRKAVSWCDDWRTFAPNPLILRHVAQFYGLDVSRLRFRW